MKFTVIQMLQWLDALWLPLKDPNPDRQRARELIAAIDAGGLPLNPARVNDIARRLGLEVSTRAPMEVTVERIRQVLEKPAPMPFSGQPK
jgi:hypothetical protein